VQCTKDTSARVGPGTTKEDGVGEVIPAGVPEACVWEGETETTGEGGATLSGVGGDDKIAGAGVDGSVGVGGAGVIGAPVRGHTVRTYCRVSTVSCLYRTISEVFLTSFGAFSKTSGPSRFLF
jgi:hypothetical protein